jgi:hypothetical protein
MSRFYGTVNGQARTMATRRGGPGTGLRTVAASWQGAVRVELLKVEEIDWAVISLIPWHGQGTTRILYSGPVSGEKCSLPTTGQ